MKLNVFSDFHHAGLLESLIMLFEDRFGGVLMRPIGREWYNSGYWKVFDNPLTVAQYLDVGGATPDESEKLNEVLNSDGNGLFECYDIDSGRSNKAITLDRFMKSHIDLVIASIPQHIRPFRKLCDSHPNKPILIYQIGNAWNIEPADERLIQGIMASARLTNSPMVPYIEYHREFSLETFKPSFKMPGQKITSFVNCFSHDPLFKFDFELFKRIEVQLHAWDFKIYGGLCRDGSKNGTQEVADAMHDSRFIWHTKSGGDGYGHVIHNTGAVARPMIVRASDYLGKMAWPLIIPDKTAIVVDGLGEGEIINKILYFSDELRYTKLAQNVYNNFKANVDFNAEAKKIDEFLIDIFKYHGKP